MTHDSDVTPTTTQPAPNISTARPGGNTHGADVPSQSHPAPNLTTEHQEEGDARFPAAGLDRGKPAQDDGGRKSSLTRNA